MPRGGASTPGKARKGRLDGHDGAKVLQDEGATITQELRPRFVDVFIRHFPSEENSYSFEQTLYLFVYFSLFVFLLTNKLLPV